MILSILWSLRITIKIPKKTIIYSASEFWMDSLPSLVLKLRFPKATFVATWYQTAPNPVGGFKEGNRKESYRLSALLYWLVQLPIKPLISIVADYVIVNNEDEMKRFPKHKKSGKIFIMYGAVNIEQIERYLREHKRQKPIYDAVFQGRFHPQKGVVELVEIWNKVVREKHDVRLAMIGDGPLMGRVKAEIEKYKLRKNIKLFGYVFDGSEKNSIFAKSRLVVHPAFYDSGGMASAEAMAFGLPCVGFNLKAYESYYPEGMVKVEKGDLNAFSDSIVKLLSNEKMRQQIGREADKMIKSHWSWERRAEDLLGFISK